MRETIEKQFVLDNLYCSSCAIKIENEIRSLDYIKNASLNFSTKNYLKFFNTNYDKIF
jgi:ferredoxin